MRRHAKVAVRHVESVLRRWDPIGVLPGPGDDMGPMDEYDSYAPQIVSLLSRGATVEAIAEHLEGIRTGMMGHPPLREVDERFAQELVSWWQEN